MTNALTQLVVWLNAVADFLGRVFFFVGVLPGWLSATLIAVLSGAGLIWMFKHTSNQRAIKRARQQIRSNLLAVKLFHDNPWVGLRAQVAALLGAFKLLLPALVPILAMLLPVTLLLGQIALWYQARPLQIGEEAVITLKLDARAAEAKVVLEPNDAVEDVSGPVRAVSQNEICWNLRAKQNGSHTLVFRVNDHEVQKELAIGDGYQRVSLRRPDWDWSNALLHPAESPFRPDSPVRLIEIQYPERSSWVSGTDSWLYYWFIVSLVAGFLLRGVFRFNL
jgi:hypothetical protein